MNKFNSSLSSAAAAAATPSTHTSNIEDSTSQKVDELASILEEYEQNFSLHRKHHFYIKLDSQRDALPLCVQYIGLSELKIESNDAGKKSEKAVIKEAFAHLTAGNLNQALIYLQRAFNAVPLNFECIHFIARLTDIEGHTAFNFTTTPRQKALHTKALSLSEITSDLDIEIIERFVKGEWTEKYPFLTELFLFHALFNQNFKDLMTVTHRALEINPYFLKGLIYQAVIYFKEEHEDLLELTLLKIQTCDPENSFLEFFEFLKENPYLKEGDKALSLSNLLIYGELLSALPLISPDTLTCIVKQILGNPNKSDTALRRVEGWLIKLESAHRNDYNCDLNYYLGKVQNELRNPHFYKRYEKHGDKLSRSYIEVALTLGQRYFEQKQYATAFIQFNQADRLKNNDPYILYHLSACYYHLEMTDKAVVYITKCQTTLLSADFNLKVKIHKLLIELYFKQNNLNEVRYWACLLTQLPSLSGSQNDLTDEDKLYAYKSIMIAFRRQKRFTEAFNITAKALEIFPDNVYLKESFCTAVCEEIKFDYENFTTALVYARELLAKHPQNETYIYYLLKISRKLIANSMHEKPDPESIKAHLMAVSNAHKKLIEESYSFIHALDFNKCYAPLYHMYLKLAISPEGRCLRPFLLHTRLNDRVKRVEFVYLKALREEELHEYARALELLNRHVDPNGKTYILKKHLELKQKVAAIEAAKNAVKKTVPNIIFTPAAAPAKDRSIYALKKSFSNKKEWVPQPAKPPVQPKSSEAPSRKTFEKASAIYQECALYFKTTLTPFEEVKFKGLLVSLVEALVAEPLQEKEKIKLHAILKKLQEANHSEAIDLHFKLRYDLPELMKML